MLPHYTCHIKTFGKNSAVLYTKILKREMHCLSVGRSKVNPL